MGVLCITMPRESSKYITYSLLLLDGGGALSASLLLALALLEKGLGDQDVVVGRDSAIDSD